MIFDPHVHYDDRRFDEDREAVIGGLPAAGVFGAVNIGCDAATSRAGLVLAERWPSLYFTAGFYPDNVAEAEAMGEEGAVNFLRELLMHPQAVGIVEI